MAGGTELFETARPSHGAPRLNIDVAVDKRMKKTQGFLLFFFFFFPPCPQAKQRPTVGAAAVAAGVIIINGVDPLFWRSPTPCRFLPVPIYYTTLECATVHARKFSYPIVYILLLLCYCYCYGVVWTFIDIREGSYPE